MTNRKGPDFEIVIADWLKTNGFPHSYRETKHGRNDVGDIGGIPGVVLELKNCRQLDLAGWMTEAKREAAQAGVEIYAVVHKRRGKADPAEQWVTMPLHVFAELIR